MRISRPFITDAVLIALGLSLMIFAATRPAPAQEAKPPEPASAEYTDGFCSGFRAAVNMERTRFLLWSRQLIAGRDQQDSIVAVVEAAAAYVLLQHPTGTFKLDVGKEVDCGTKPAEKPAAPEAAK